MNLCGIHISTNNMSPSLMLSVRFCSSAFNNKWNFGYFLSWIYFSSFIYLFIYFEDPRRILAVLLSPFTLLWEKFLYPNHLLLYITNKNFLDIDFVAAHNNISNAPIKQKKKKTCFSSYSSYFILFLILTVQLSILHVWMMNTVDRVCCHLHYFLTLVQQPVNVQSFTHY